MEEASIQPCWIVILLDASKGKPGIPQPMSASALPATHVHRGLQSHSEAHLHRTAKRPQHSWHKGSQIFLQLTQLLIRDDDPQRHENTENWGRSLFSLISSSD